MPILFAAQPSRSATQPITLPGGPAGQSLPYLVLALAALWLQLNWEQIPERFATHYDGQFQPDGWADKSTWTVFGILLFGAALCLMMTGISAALARTGSRSIARRFPAGSEAYDHASKRHRSVLWILLAVSLQMAVIFALVSLGPLLEDATSQRTLLVTVLAMAFLDMLIVPLLLITPAGRSLLQPSKAEQKYLEPGASKHWKGGLFYYNPDDSRLWVEKLTGLGYTFNFARPAAWVILGLLLLAPLVVLVAVAL